MASSTCVLRGHEGMSLQALAVALQHPVVAEDQRNICSMLQVSKAWRAAVQQSAASITHISMCENVSMSRLSTVSSFAGWLVKYPGLIGALKIKFRVPLPVYNEDFPEALSVANQIAGLGLQAAAAAAVFGTGLPLRLHSFETTIPPTAGMMAALPATLTQLVLTRLDNSNWYHALSKLCNLHEMKLRMWGMSKKTADKCLCAIRPLKQLQRLVLEFVPGAINMHVLPVSLQHLQLWYDAGPVVLGDDDGDDGPADERSLVDLQHLTRLRELVLMGVQLAEGSSIPSSLLTLRLDAEWPPSGLVGLAGVTQLQEAVIGYDGYNYRPFMGEDMRALQMSTQLQYLSLDLGFTSEHSQCLRDVSAAWHSLPLCDLSIVAPSLTAGDLQQLALNVAVATKLTSLSIRVIRVTQVEADEQGIETPGLVVCERLKHLVDLSSLNLSIGHPSDFALQDAEHLTALSALTSLCLCLDGAGPFVDDAIVCSLACSLTQLRSLTTDLPVGVSVLPVIGRLTTLEQLILMTLSADDAERGLQFLTGLSRLSELRGFHAAGPAALTNFWARVRSES